MPQPAKPYEFVEFPKHVIVAGRTITVNSEAEEAEALSQGKVVREEDERKRMLAVADLYGLQVDKRWRLDRIAEVIRNAGYDPEFDPSK